MFECVSEFHVSGLSKISCDRYKSGKERITREKLSERRERDFGRKSFLSVSNKVGEQDTRLNSRDKAVRC